MMPYTYVILYSELSVFFVLPTNKKQDKNPAVLKSTL